MTQSGQKKEKVQIRVPADVARIMSKWGGHGVRLAAARGALPMSGPNLVMVLFVFYHGENEELRQEALTTLQTLPSQILLSALSQPELHSSVIDLIVHLRHDDPVVMEKVLAHSETSVRSLFYLAENSSGDVLDMLSHQDNVLTENEAVRVAIINNPHADKVTKLRLGWIEPQPTPAVETGERSASEGSQQEAAVSESEEGVVGEGEETGEEGEHDANSKYQLLQEMTVNEKIKMALTGDKEWRTLLIREANKQVNTSVLRNPRITEGEVLAVAQSRSSSEELIRIILLNRDWTKIYDVKKALIHHPRTPLQQAMRMMEFLSERDLRELTNSRNVNQPIINNARRILMNRKR